VTVIVKEIKSRPVYFIGGFTKPGVEQLTRDLTVLQAVSIAGGLLPTADGDNGFILRGDKRIPVDFTKLMQKGEVAQNVNLGAGSLAAASVALRQRQSFASLPSPHFGSGSPAQPPGPRQRRRRPPRRLYTNLRPSLMARLCSVSNLASPCPVQAGHSRHLRRH